MSSMQYIEALKFLVNSIGKKYTFCTETGKAEEAPLCPPEEAPLVLPANIEPTRPITHKNNNIKKEIAKEFQEEREEGEEAYGGKGLQGVGVCPQTWAEREASLPAGDPEEEFYLPELSLTPEAKEKYYDYIYQYKLYQSNVKQHLIHIPEALQEVWENYPHLHKKTVVNRDRVYYSLQALLQEKITTEELSLSHFKKLLQNLFRCYCEINNRFYLEDYKKAEQTELFKEKGGN